MVNNRRLIVFAAIFALIALVLHAVWLWQPERQAILHTEHLLKAAEKRNFTKFSAMMDPQYSDRWGHDKNAAVALTSEVLRQFFVLTIKSEITDSAKREDGIIVSARLQLQGNGTAVAVMATDEVNRLTEPFQFEWKHASGKPWDWLLVRVEQPQLHLSDANF